MLTRKQHELLRFIHERLRESGIPPSFDEMKEALDLKSKSGIHRLITALEERGSMATPVMGRIAAGTPVSAIQNPSHSITVSPEFLGGGEHYALEVRGDSMIDAGILDGDMVVISKQETANTGDIIVALIDEEEATLKRFRRRGSSIALEPANASHETRLLGPDRVKIQGKLVSLVRRH